MNTPITRMQARATQAAMMIESLLSEDGDIGVDVVVVSAGVVCDR